MKKIAVIGIGSLGLRHLESLVKSDTDYNLFAVEPFEVNRNNAIKYFRDLSETQSLQKVIFFQSIDELPMEIDVVIIATGANIRFQLIQDLLASKKVAFLLLEKVLFQRVREYDACSKLLEQFNTKVFVNCPMRSYEAYQQIKSFFGEDIPVSMSVSGADWSMGCNAVHYLDLFAFLTGGPAKDIILNLDKKIKESKRPGYIEFTGIIRGVSSSSQIILHSIENAKIGKIILLFAINKYCIIDEQAGYYMLCSETEVQKKDFRMPYQSELTDSVVKGILETSLCQLSSYAESEAVHLPFIEALAEHMKRDANSKLDYVPIT